MAPLSPEAKAALMERLKAGREKTKAMREEAKKSGLPDPKPRKVRKDKKAPKTSDGALQDPMDSKPANETIAPIGGAVASAVNQVAAVPPEPVAPKTSKIDVPNLPNGKNAETPKMPVVDDAADVKPKKPRKGISTTGVPKQYNDNIISTQLETGDEAISVMYPGQKESIKKSLKQSKKDDPIQNTPKPNELPFGKTVKKVKTHLENPETISGAKPFSFSEVRKMLFQ